MITNGALDVAGTVKAFQDALNAAVAEIGTAWGTTRGVHSDGPVVVTDITSEMAAWHRQPTLMAGTARLGQLDPTATETFAFDASTQCVFEITFQGSVHDQTSRFTLKSSTLSRAAHAAIITTETNADAGTRSTMRRSP